MAGGWRLHICTFSREATVLAEGGRLPPNRSSNSEPRAAAYGHMRALGSGMLQVFVLAGVDSSLSELMTALSAECMD